MWNFSVFAFVDGSTTRSNESSTSYALPVRQFRANPSGSRPRSPSGFSVKFVLLGAEHVAHPVRLAVDDEGALRRAGRKRGHLSGRGSDERE
jgi:hypothetical protein